MSMTKTQRISADVLAAIGAGEWRDGGFVMPPLDRKVYLKVSEVLKSLGGKWDRRTQTTLFADEDAETALREAVATGEYVDPRRLYEFFETPPELVGRLLDAVGGRWSLSGKAVLEPSAGCGSIAEEARRAGAEVWTIELNPKMAAGLKEAGLHNSCGDFLEVADSRDYDFVLMNPPFSRGQDIRHVMHAAKFLKPGGRLAAIMGAGCAFNSSRLATEFRAWLAELEGDIERLPENSFRVAGTGVNTVLVSLELPS